MPAHQGDQFVEAVKPALEALLSDLQHTTEVLKRGQRSDRYSGGITTRRDNDDIEPIYQEQTTRTARSPSHGLDHLEQMLDEYSEKRKSRDASERPGSAADRRPSVHSLMHQLDENRFLLSEIPSVCPPPAHLCQMMYELQHRLDHYSSRRSLGPQQQHGYGASSTDLRRSPSRDPSQLDSMINTLNSDMSKHGISTIPKGDCASCGKPIIGQVVIALGKMWHPEHYVCCQCGEELGHRNFFERGGKAYCEDDYHNMFSPRCGYCSGPIKDRCISALGKTFHPEHFVCAECGHEFGDEGFHEKARPLPHKPPVYSTPLQDGRAYCKNDYFALFAPKCHGCRNTIRMNFITALGTQWHPECFVCQDCRRPFDGGSFFEHLGAPFCEQHYHEKRGSLCVVCRAPISGRCVSAMGQKFHPEHFTCSYCHRQLNKGTFKEVDRRPFCHKCYQQTHS
ncbi:hypothetical protein QR680_012614 [Steinernema hermaphroditum]|uniref:LIM zinc-binding domain-containing protein n=1 Tax=Steinernema hermaphroditum TaxID=289476 RepID=A0AA39M113_9BILA|nr:hypothetical protein QR680_012614 [Steinernema hermaphroditum]